MIPRTAVITIAHGRHDHLEGQLWGLTLQTVQPDVVVAVAMDDADIADVVAAHAAPGWGVRVPWVAATDEGLPLAAARNVGARSAVDAGADHLVFLDVDCIPSPGLVERYAAVLGSVGGSPPAGVSPLGAGSPLGRGSQFGRGPVLHAEGPLVACGEVGYLPPVASPQDYLGADLASLARAHPSRPQLADDEVRAADDLRLFWSLSFAVTARDWVDLGGFCEEYVGYGGEDTDFGQRIGAADGTMLWVGGAAAYHQHHPSESPPTQHLTAIVANANRFRRRWGWFPMEGWLELFASMGLADLDEPSGEWRVLAPVTPGPRAARPPA